MIIETKLSIGDTAYFMVHNKIYSSKIVGIVAEVGCNNREIYEISDNPAGRTYTTRWHSFEIFSSKEDLLNTL